MYSHILICTDGSELSQKGVDHGLALSKCLGTRATAVFVTERYPIYPSPGLTGGWTAIGPSEFEAFAAAQTEAAERILAKVKESAANLGTEVKTVHISEAEPAEAIVQAAKTYECDLIVMASNGRRGLGRLLLGSQTSEVLTTSSVPVLVVR